MDQNYYLKNEYEGIDLLNKLYDLDEKLINVIMEPYKSKYVIEEFIKNKQDRKILYLSFKESIIDLNLNVKKLKFDLFTKVKEQYDIIIIDDLASYSPHTISSLIEIVEILFKYANKIMIFAIDYVLEKAPRVYITTQTTNSHFKEPRVIISRFDLSERIPEIFYEYLEWFHSKKEIVIIYVKHDKAKSIYNKFLEFQKAFEDMKIILYKEEKDFPDFLTTSKDSIIIYDNVKHSIDKISNANIILYSEDKMFFNYKEIVFLCGRYSMFSEKREFILLSKKESHNIDKARKIARKYNEIAWRD